jgi:hypothetical protein
MGEASRTVAHHLFYSLTTARQVPVGTPVREFDGYSVSFDGGALAVGTTKDAAPGAKLTRMC